MFLLMLAGSSRVCTGTPSPPTGGTLCGRPERKESGSGERETGRCFCPCWQGTAEAVQGHPHHLQEVHFVVRQRERKVDVESGETGRCFCLVGWGGDTGGREENGREIYFTSYFQFFEVACLRGDTLELFVQRVLIYTHNLQFNSIPGGHRRAASSSQVHINFCF